MFEIGTSLREARLRRHVDFTDAEHGTKIRSKYLGALEDERFELLPSHTYVKGFLRTYAEYLGLDGQLYVDEYNSRYVTGEDDAPMRAPRRVPAARARRSDRRESRLLVLALGAIVLVTALVFVAWRFGGPENEPVHGLTTASQPRPAVQRPQAAGAARVELRATRGDSFLVVRSRSALGEVLYRGTLERRQKQFFDGQVLWIQLKSPQNVLVRRNGNRIRLPDAVKNQGVFVTAKRIFAADPA